MKRNLAPTKEYQCPNCGEVARGEMIPRIEKHSTGRETDLFRCGKCENMFPPDMWKEAKPTRRKATTPSVFHDSDNKKRLKEYIE